MRILILILEDNPQDVELMLDALHDLAPFEHTVVDTEKAYVAALDRGKWDAILADYALPTYDALHALSELVDRGLKIPFIVVTGVLGKSAANVLLKLGASAYVLKDDMSKLGEIVAGLIEKS